VPIPGTKRVAYLEDNAGAPAVQLTPEDEQRLDALAGRVQGERYGGGQQRLNRVASPPLSPSA